MRMKGKTAIFNYKDTFSLCDTLRPIIYQGVKKFRDTLKKRCDDDEYWSHPYFSDVPNLAEEDYGDYWFTILDQIVEGFSYDYFIIPLDDEDKHEKIKNAYDLLGKYFNHLWW